MTAHPEGDRDEPAVDGRDGAVRRGANAPAPPHGRRAQDGPGDPETFARVLDRNIRALVRQRKMEEMAQPAGDKVADAVRRFTGSMRFVYIHAVLFSAWIILNVAGPPALRFDPTLVVLAMVASVEGLFLATFVLISQNRMQELADRRADLDVQISLLAEHEITRLVRMVAAMSEKMGVQAVPEEELAEITHDVAPEAVLERLDLQEAAIEKGMEPIERRGAQ